MARRNVRTESNIRTHEGGPAVALSAEQSLRRTIMTALLWEDSFYEDGEFIEDRIREEVGSLVSAGQSDIASKLAIEARTQYRIRHAPLIVALALSELGDPMGWPTVYGVVQRPDELTELVAMFWDENPKRKNLPKGLKRGLRKAFRKFDEYQLAKWDRKSDRVRLRDVAFLVHAKPSGGNYGEPVRDDGGLYARMVNKDTIPERTKASRAPVRELTGMGSTNPGLSTPDTWETALSARGNTADEWRRLMDNRKLGHMAALRNLRNMQEAGLTPDEVENYLVSGAARSPVLPFRYVAAAMEVPDWESIIDKAMMESLGWMETIPGHTVILVDVSASMTFHPVSKRSKMYPRHVAAALAAMMRELSDRATVRMFETDVHKVPDRHGMGLVDAIVRGPNGGTNLGKAVDEANQIGGDRLVVVTDEQTSDRVPQPVQERSYMVNVQPYKRGVGYSQSGWTVHVDGWSEQVVRFIQEFEKGNV